MHRKCASMNESGSLRCAWLTTKEIRSEWCRLKRRSPSPEKRGSISSRLVDVKEVKYRPNINIHDFETKTRRARKFLEQGKHVKVTIMFRMREMRRPENGFDLLKRVGEYLEDVAIIERMPTRLEGRDLTMVLRPSKKT